MAYFVYYEDGYCGNGDHGIADFGSKQKALDFIMDRIKRKQKEKEYIDFDNLDDYTQIAGKKLKIEVVKRIAEIEAK